MSDSSDTRREPIEHEATGDAGRPVTHRDLMPRDLCRHLMFKQILTEGLDNPVGEGRTWPGDGYYWCLLTLHDVGPDDEIVEPPACRGERGCCEGLES